MPHSKTSVPLPISALVKAEAGTAWPGYLEPAVRPQAVSLLLWVFPISFEASAVLDASFALPAITLAARLHHVPGPVGLSEGQFEA